MVAASLVVAGDPPVQGLGEGPHHRRLHAVLDLDHAAAGRGRVGVDDGAGWRDHGQRAERAGIDVGARVEKGLDDGERPGRGHGGAHVGRAGRLRGGAREIHGDRLARHGDGGAHGQRLEPHSTALEVRLVDVFAFAKPAVKLIDGRGARFTPWSTDVASLREYTLGAQIVEPFDFALAVRTALREHAPEHLVCPGPGNSLGGVCAQILIAEGWRGIRSKDEFQRAHGHEPGVARPRTDDRDAHPSASATSAWK